MDNATSSNLLFSSNSRFLHLYSETRKCNKGWQEVVNALISMQAAAPKGIVCNTGILGNEWIIKNFEPLVDIPSTVKLTVYNSETVTAANRTKALEHVVEGVAMDATM